MSNTELAMVLNSAKVIQVDRQAIVKVPAPFQDMLRQALTIVPPPTSDREVMVLYDEIEPGIFSIPRALVSKQKVPIILRSWPCLPSPFLKDLILRPVQREMLLKFTEGLKTYPYGGILKAPTGTGKTVMAIDLMSRINLKTLVIVPTDHLMGQWHEALKTFSHLTDRNIGKIRGATCKVDKCPVTIGMLHTIIKDKYPIRNLFGHVIFDEVHRVGAETFSRAAPLFHCSIRTGLSATPRRKDGAENLFFWHIGPVLAESGKADVTPYVLMVNYYNLGTHHSGCVWSGSLNIGRYYNKITNSAPRNRLLAKLISGAYKKGHHILLLSERIKMLDILKDILPEYGVESEDIGIFRGGFKQPERRILLATYGSAELGMDIPRLTCVVFGTPRTDVEQAVGRIMRKKAEGGLQPVVVDVTDTSSFLMNKWQSKRLSFYKGKGLSIQKVTVED